MVGVLDDVGRQDDQPAEPSRRFDRRRWSWAVAAGFLLVALVWGVVWVGANVVYYQPLGSGPWGPPANEEAMYLDLPGGDLMEVIPAKAGLEFRAGTSISNAGAHPVTIDHVQHHPVVDADPLGALMVLPGSFDIADARPFEAFELEPGESAWVGHRYRFRDCPFPLYDPRPLHERLAEDGRLFQGGHQAWDVLTVEFSVRGWTRHATLPLMVTPFLDGIGSECPVVESASGVGE